MMAKRKKKHGKRLTKQPWQGGKSDDLADGLQDDTSDDELAAALLAAGHKQYGYVFDYEYKRIRGNAALLVDALNAFIDEHGRQPTEAEKGSIFLDMAERGALKRSFLTGDY